MQHVRESFLQLHFLRVHLILEIMHFQLRGHLALTVSGSLKETQPPVALNQLRSQEPEFGAECDETCYSCNPEEACESNDELITSLVVCHDGRHAQGVCKTKP